jgi:uncharacterized protein
VKPEELHILYEARVGSRAYGTDIPGSDEDFKGFAVVPRRYYTGFLNRFEQQESKDPDRVIYNVSKFFRLATDCNPAIIEVLFCDEKDIVTMNPIGKMVRDNRDLFLSAKARFTFLGYAVAQLHKLQLHPGKDKHAMHLVRLVRMGEEILSGKGVIVNRPDREELLAIRNGHWCMEWLERFTREAETRLETLYWHSPLAKEPDRRRLDDLCTQIVEMVHSGDQSWANS